MIEIKIGDCTQRLKDLEDNSVVAVICDPPYGIKFMSKGWDDIGDGGQQREWHRKWLTQAHRVLKPSGVLKTFSGTRTFHHLIYMMEEIGFSELRVEAWTYGSGFPKSRSISKDIDKTLGEARKVVGYRKGIGLESGKSKGFSYSQEHIPGVCMGGKEVQIDLPITVPASKEAHQYEGWGTALKPAWEPVCIGVKK